MTAAPSTPFSVDVAIRFSHSDPAGIVYYPNYFDMFNAVIEDWFAGALGVPYFEEILVRRRGFPMVHAECDFFIPSRMGDRLSMTVLIKDIGRSSLKLSIIGHVGAQERLRATLVVVLINLENHQSMPIPPDLRERLERYRAGCGDWQLGST